MPNNSIPPILNSRVSQASFQLCDLQLMFQSIAYVAEYSEPEAIHHLHRVSAYARFVADKVLHWSELECRRLEIAALLHDVGKVAIPRELLLKPGTLTREERRYIAQHADRGYEIVRKLEQNFFERNVSFDKTLFSFTKQVAHFHHENFNGTGYPQRLSGSEIPIVARIVKLVDVMDALLSSRPYKDAWPWERVREEIQRLSGTEFDHALVQGFLNQEPAFLEFNAPVRGFGT